MRSAFAQAFFGVFLIVAGCAGPVPSTHTSGEEVVCLSAPIENGRAYLAQHREALAAEIVGREVFIIADARRVTIQTARVAERACDPSEQQLTPEAYRQARDQFVASSCDVSEPFIREYLERRGIGGVASRSS